MSEFALQCFAASLLRYSAARGVIWYAVPNGEARSATTGARLKKSGVRPGVADIALVLPPGQAAFMELKWKAGKLSPAQKKFQADCETSGALHAVARTSDEVRAVLAGWGALRP
jgi:hypothetical protein